jgi:hypothetical protein
LPYFISINNSLNSSTFIFFILVILSTPYIYTILYEKNKD